MKDSILLDNLKNQDNYSYDLLYKLYFPSIANFIKKNNGNHQDAEDIFQEAVLVFLKKIKTQDFILTSSIKTYLYSISKNIWLKYLRDNKLFIMENDSLFLNYSINDKIDDDLSYKEKLAILIEKITDNCKYILKAIFFQKELMSNVMEKMGWKNKHTASNQQYKCIQQIKKQAKKDI